MKSICGLAVVLIAVRTCVWAAEPTRVQEFIALALAHNSEVLAAQKRYEAARQRPKQEASLPDPVLSVSYTSNGGPLPGQGLGVEPTSNIGFMVSQELPSAGKRRLRGQIAQKEADAEFQQYQAVQLNVRSRVIQAFHRLHHAYAALEILTQGKALLAQLVRVAETRYAVGKAAQQDVFKAQTELSILETRLVRMEQDRRTAEAELNSLLNRPPDSPLSKPEEGEPTLLGLTLAELLAQAEQITPSLRREQTMIERSELAVNLARREFHPNSTVSGGYFNQGSMPAMYQFRLDIPLPLRPSRRQQPALTEQVSRLAEARRNYEAAGQALQFRVRESYFAAETAARLMKLYADTILPQSTLTIEASLTAYETGTTDFLSVLTNLKTKVDSEERYHEERLNYELALARLEELTGVPLKEAKP